MFKIMADNGIEISAKQDGALYNVALNDQDFIIKGLGDEFAMSYTGLVVSVESGECVVHGRHIMSEETNTITLPSNESGYLVLRIDLTKPVGQEALLFATPTLTHEEINWSGTIYDMPIATFTTQTIDISNFDDVRIIKNIATPHLELKTINGQTIEGVGNIEIGLQIDLLWTNASPSSSFNSQKISLNLNDYKLIMITHKNGKSGYAPNENTNKIFTKTGHQVLISNYGFGQAGYGSRRSITVNDTGVTFGTSYYFGTGNVSNDFDIPQEIYGIK